MIPFRVTFRPGKPVYEQVVYAAKKAMMSGHLRPGDPFPSVRALSKELKINPNTAHKIVASLVAAGLLETRPGVGTLVAELPEPNAAQRTELLDGEIEELAVEAKRLAIGLNDVLASVTAHWKELGGGNRGKEDRERGGGRKR
jgi:GntR family transcriptional regulator